MFNDKETVQIKSAQRLLRALDVAGGVLAFSDAWQALEAFLASGRSEFPSEELTLPEFKVLHKLRGLLDTAARLPSGEEDVEQAIAELRLAIRESKWADQ